MNECPPAAAPVGGLGRGYVVLDVSAWSMGLSTVARGPPFCEVLGHGESEEEQAS